MTIKNRTDYQHAIDAIGICISAGVPVLIWGNPGEGKTSLIESATHDGWHVETVIISQSEPSDLAGLPVVGPDGSVRLAPPAWARRLAEADGRSICFFDEFSTAQPSLQAAALRVLTHGEVGALQLPSTVSFVAAANPIDVAAAGWELAAPTASRFVHLDFAMPIDVFTECAVFGTWPSLRVHDLPDDFDDAVVVEMLFVTGFLKARTSQLSNIPKDAAARGRAFPTPRTWGFVGRLLTLAREVGAPEEVVRLLVEGAVGEATAHEFMTWRSHLDLPDPEELLNGGPADFRHRRPDQLHVILQGVVAALDRDLTADRWSRAVALCCDAAAEAGVESAVPAIRALMGPGRRPGGASVPPEVTVFAPVLALAGLLPEGER